MRDLIFKFENRVDFSDMVTEHDYLLRCIPSHTPDQQILSFSLDIEPGTGAGSFGMDSFGNRTYVGRIGGKHKFFKYGISGRIMRDDTKKVLDDNPMHCLRYFSHLTQPNVELKSFLDGMNIDPDLKSMDVANIIASEVYRYYKYTPGSTHTGTTAGEAFASGQGVCQDYAHTFLTLARMKGIPARYVSGLPEGDGVSHAWVEIWNDGLWYGLDPTRNRLVDEGYIKLCTGRDFNDCPIERGSFWGAVQQVQTTWMEVK